MNARTRCAVLLMLGTNATFCTAARAQLAGYNVDIGDPDGPAGVPADSFGAAAAQVGHWNCLGADAEAETLLDLNGADYGVTATSSGGYTDLHYNSLTTTGNHEDLLDDFQDTDDDGGPILWSIDGLEPGAYMVFVYAMAPDGPLFSASVATPQSLEGPESAGGTFADGYVAGVTHTVHSVNVGLNGELAIVIYTDAQFATISGFQIVPVEGIAGTYGEATGDQFGRAVANIGDVDQDTFDDFIIAAPFNDEGGANSGKVYIYSGHTGEVLHVQSGAAAGDQFGNAVAGAGDVNLDGHADYLVGAPFHDTNGPDDGAVYLYSGLDFSLLYTKVGQRPGDRFGHAVAGGVDADDDGRPDFLVGAPYNDDRGSAAGRAYLFSGATGTKLATFSGKRKGDKFGWAVAMLERADSDSHGDFVIGAPYNDDQDKSAGKVYVYSGDGFDLLYSIEGAERGDQFGMAIAAAGLVDADGRDDFVVGSPYHDKSSTDDGGRIDVFSGKTGNRLWYRTGQADNDRFGWVVAGPGDVNGDGRADIVTVGPWYDAAGADAGRAQVRSGADGGTLALLDGVAAGDQFGWAVAGLSDPLDQGYNDLLIGAPLNDTTGPAAGRAYVFSFSPGDGTSSAHMPEGGDLSVKRSAFDAALVAIGEPPSQPAPAAPCPSDLNHDGAVDSSDLAQLVEVWGPCQQCPGDLNADHIVNHEDLTTMVRAWGPCPKGDSN